MFAPAQAVTRKPTAAVYQFFGWEARRKSGRKGTLQHAGLNDGTQGPACLLRSRPLQRGLNRKPLYNGKEVNGKEVDQGFARKAQQEPKGKMEGTETAAAAEAL
jgi:hypothetical protein